MIARILPMAALAWALTAASSHAVQSEADAAVVLMPKYVSAADPAQMLTLVDLQLVAGQYAKAEASIERLAALGSPTSLQSRRLLYPWRIYARAKRYEAEGASAQAALSRAFAELYATLPDREAAEVLPWYGANISALRRSVESAKAACGAVPLEACSTAAAVMAQQANLEVWSYLMPASEPLLATDARRRFFVDDQLLIPTPDGARIAAMVLRPRNRGHRLTSLLNFTIYANDAWSFADAFKMAAYGYAGVVAYSRGKGRSPGPVTPYVHDGNDAATVIGWLAHQPWSDGRVGMFSGSYNAFTQWAAAKHRPAALKALATNASNAPGIDTPMQGNVFQSFVYPWPFYTTDVKGLDDATYGQHDRWDRLMRNWYLSGRPYRDLELLDGHPNPVFAEWLRHPSYDDYWRRLIPAGREFADIDLPVFVQTGYFDGGMVGALHYMKEHDRYRPRADHRLLVGPYHHTAMQTGVLSKIDGYTVDRAAMVDLQDIRLKWFDHVFRGSPLPDILRARVNFQVMGADRWRHVDSLDEMATSRIRLYLTGGKSGGRLLFGPEESDVPPPLLRVDFADRSDADDEPPSDGIDDRNALVFATKPLSRPTEIDGLFRGHFEGVADKRDFDLSVNFFEQGPDRRYLPLASYLGRVSYMKDPSHRQLLRPGRRFALDFTSQTLTSRLMPAGSRLIAVVGVPKRPDIQINYGTGRDVSDESLSDAKDPLQIQWRNPSYLEIGVRK